MLDTAIHNFLNERKENWLKKKIKVKTSEEEKLLFEQQAKDEFSLAFWLPNAAKRAKQLSLVSHPGKFTHPSARTSPIIASQSQSNDGYLRTGNVNADLDVLGNAAALDVYKFLSLTLDDGKTVLSHLENSTDTIKKQFTIPTASYKELESGLLAIKQDKENTVKTSGRIKQVYFPVNQEHSQYHLLSILTPSNLMFALKERINHIRFSDQAKSARQARKDNNVSETGYSDFPGLTVIGYGGTKPQNISVLNNSNAGVAYLLSSMPPQLEKRTIHPPKNNFFSGYLYLDHFEGEFKKFHQQILDKRRNKPMRDARDSIIRNILYQLADKVWHIRYLDAGWSDSDYYQNLPKMQKIWLDRQYRFKREDNQEYEAYIKNKLSRWFLNSYDELFKEEAIELGDKQIKHLKDMIDQCEVVLL